MGRIGSSCNINPTTMKIGIGSKKNLSAIDVPLDSRGQNIEHIRPFERVDILHALPVIDGPNHVFGDEMGFLFHVVLSVLSVWPSSSSTPRISDKAKQAP